MLMLSDFKVLKDYEDNWNVRRVRVNPFYQNAMLLLYEYEKSSRGEMAFVELPEATLLVVKEQRCEH